MMIKDIREWEEEFSKQIQGVKLLGEIELNQSDFEALTEQMQAVFKRSPNHQQVTERFKKYYPCTFAVFLVHFAARNTQRDFWAALANLLEVPGTSFHVLQWHRLFIRVLEEHRKKTFLDVGGASNKYVTAIRIHGGIPVYSLGDFFQNMLRPATENKNYAGLPPAELLNALLQRTDVQIFTDSPVRNFFENSGEVGLAFLGECIKMAQTYRKDSEIPTGLELPAYVIEKYIDHTEKQVDFETRLKSPRLLFSPETEGLQVELPQQQINANDLRGNEQALWQVSWDGLDVPIQKTTRLAFSGRDILTRASQHDIPNPVQRVRVAFGLQGQNEPRILRRWSLHCLPAPDQPQLLAFSVQPNEEGYYPILRSLTASLPAKLLLIVYPRNAHLEFGGHEDKRHECDPFNGDWRNWQAAFWSLENTSSLTLEQPGRPETVYRITAPVETPQLVGGRLHPSADPKNLPLYLGAPPRLRLPHRSRQTWKVELQSVWETQPVNIQHEFAVSDFEVTDTTCELDLEAVLGPEPAGTYILRFSNRLDIEDEIRFRAWPRLQVQDLPLAVFPSEQTTDKSESIKFNLSLPTSASCEPFSAADDLQISGSYGQYQVSLSESIARADVALTLPFPDGEGLVRVPLFIPVPRLQWRVHLPEEESALEWDTTTIQHPVAAFLQSQKPAAILVRLHGIETLRHQLELVLIDPDNPKEILQRLMPERSQPGENILRYELNQAEITIKQNQHIAAFAFQLRLWRGPGEIQSAANLLSLARTLEISAVWMESHGEMDYTLHWKEPSPLRNRRVFLYPAWQPWNEGQEFSIPDDAHGELHLGIMSLPPSSYEAYFYIAPYRDAPRRETRPNSAQPHHFETIDPAHRLRDLEHEIHEHPEKTFLPHFERAVICDSMGKTADREREISAAIQSHAQAPLKYLACFYDWLGDHNEIEQKALRYKMLTPNRIQEVYAKTRPSEPLRYAYMRHAQFRTLSTQSAVVILENEAEDPQLIVFCLRLLMERNEPRGIAIILEWLKNGRLSDENANSLLSEHLDFSLRELGANLEQVEALRLFCKLFQKHEHPESLIQSLPASSLLLLSSQEQAITSLSVFLVSLILRAEKSGVEQTMKFFEQGTLRGDEVTDLFGRNPAFAYQTLKALPSHPAYNAILSSLAQTYPAETGQTVAAYIHPANNVPVVHSMAENQHSHIKNLIKKRDKTGIHQAMNFFQQGLLTDEQLMELFQANPQLAYQVLIESPKFEQYREQIITLARAFPFETGYITPRMSIKTPGGWGVVKKIYQIQNSVKKTRVDIACLDEVDVELHVSLDSRLQDDLAVIELGQNRILFPGAEKVFICQVCKQFISQKIESVERHHNLAHLGQQKTIREHVPVMPLYLPYQVKPAPNMPPEIAERHPVRDEGSLWLASLPNKKVLSLLETNGPDSGIAYHCVNILLKKEQKDCMAYLLKQYHSRRLTQARAMALLTANPGFAYDYLESQPSSRQPVALMQELRRTYPDEVY